MSKQALAMLRKLDRRISVKWESLESVVTRHGGEVVKPEIECAGCHRTVPVTEAMTTVIFGVHGDELPVKGYVHCGRCALRMDPKEAWVLADQITNQPWWEANPQMREEAERELKAQTQRKALEAAPHVRGHDE